MKRILYLAVIAGMLIAQEASVRMTLNEGKYFIGDRIRITYEVNGSGTQIFLIPDLREWIDRIEILDQETSTRNKKDRRITRIVVEAVAFDTGFVLLPAVPVICADSTGFGVRDTLFTPEKYIYIHSMLDSTASALPLNPPLPLHLMTWWEILISAVLLFLSLFLLWRGLRHRNGKPDEEGTPWESPQDTARRDIERLVSKNYPEKGEWKAFYLELTDIVRDFLEKIHYIHLHELSTTELLPVLKPFFGDERYRQIRDFFQSADLVKFAKGIAGIEQCDKDLALIRKIIGESEADQHTPGLRPDTEGPFAG
ncbi:MAG: hypothetical protein JXR21_05020 [Candidatus Marinimicrobia bacterium]|nr:hypothetical protein [Candidatus Neomarinimicrobiota bacterium]